MNRQRDKKIKTTTADAGFASGAVMCKLGALCFLSSAVPVASFVLRNPPERNARKRSPSTTAKHVRAPLKNKQAVGKNKGAFFFAGAPAGMITLQIDYAQAIKYLKACRLENGLLIKFGANTLAFNSVHNKKLIKRNQDSDE